MLGLLSADSQPLQVPLSSLRRTTRERKYALDAIEAALKRLQPEDGVTRGREEHVAMLDSVAHELETWQHKVRSVRHTQTTHGACGAASALRRRQSPALVKCDCSSWTAWEIWSREAITWLILTVETQRPISNGLKSHENVLSMTGWLRLSAVLAGAAGGDGCG
jgi:hypothetical protein